MVRHGRGLEAALQAVLTVKSLTPAELEAVTTRTLSHYDGRAREFWVGTQGHDVAQNYAALLDAITGTPPFHLLDFGCGPGRDLAHFRALGHEAVGLAGERLPLPEEEAAAVG